MLGLLAPLENEAKALPTHATRQPLPDSTLARVALGGGTQGLLAVSGMGQERAATAVRALIAHKASPILLFGTCGGLEPGLTPGGLILASRLTDAGGNTIYNSPAGLLSRAELALRPLDVNVRLGSIASLPEPVLGVETKVRLAESSGCLGVDMDSAGAALAAAQAGVELLVLRAVVDPHNCAVAPELPELIDATGRVRPLVLTKMLVKKPALAAELAAMGQRFSKASAALGAALGPLCLALSPDAPGGGEPLS